VLAAVNADQHDCLRYLVETYLAFAMALPRIWYQQGRRHVLSVGLLCWLDLDGDSFSKIELALGLVTLMGLLACSACRKESNQPHLYQVLFPAMDAALNHSWKGRTQKVPFALFSFLS